MIDVKITCLEMHSRAAACSRKLLMTNQSSNTSAIAGVMLMQHTLMCVCDFLIA